jgi:outer membrane biosynthesis protein TonB
VKLKYYLRGLGIGIIVTTIILVSCFSMQKPKMTDAQIIEKASQLGMIMPEQDSVVAAETETTEPEETQQKNEQQVAAEEAQQETEQQTEVPKEQATEETQQDAPSEDTENAENEESAQQEPFTLVVNRGDVCRTMCENLAANGVIDDSEGLRKYLSEVGYASFISAGTYQIPYHASYEEITNILKAGPMEQQQ